MNKFENQKGIIRLDGLDRFVEITIFLLASHRIRSHRIASGAPSIDLIAMWISELYQSYRRFDRAD